MPKNLKLLDDKPEGTVDAAGLENRLGKLAPGYHADLIVLDRDPFQIDPEQLRDMLPAATMIAGEWVYRNPQIEEITSNA